MSKTNLPAGGSTLFALAIIAFLVTGGYAADPNKSPDPNASARGKKSVAKALARSPMNTPAPLTVTPPTPPAKRTPASFTRDMSFGEAIDILRNCTTTPLNIVVLWKDIEENAGVYRETPIGLDGVPGLRVRQYIEMLVLSLSGGASAKLGYVVNNGVVTIGTVDSLPAPKRVTRVYDISDLVAEPANYFFPPWALGMGSGGSMMGGGYGPMMGQYGGYGNSMMGQYGGYGSPMMGPYGGYGGGTGVGYGYSPGMSYIATGPVGPTRDAGLSNVVGSVNGRARQSNAIRRR